LKPTVKLKIKSKPGTDGTIYAASCCVGSTDSKPANNIARIVFKPTAGHSGTGGGTGSGSGGGSTGGQGGGGGLPVTGTPVALIAGVGGAVLVLGIVLMVVFRRSARD
jgi:hypothetical protein